MNSLRVRFSIGFSILFTVFLGIALLIVYISFADFRKEEFYNRLKDRARTTFKLLTEVEQIDQDLLQVIDRNTLNSLYDEKVMIFEGNKLIYSSIDDKKIQYNERLLREANVKKEIETTEDNDELIAIYVEQNGKVYTLLAEAYDTYGQSKMNFLKWVLVTVYVTGLIVGWTVIFFFVKGVIKPLEILKKELQNINSANLNTRVKQSKQGNEVDNLAANFNQLLERLQQSFSIQKDFVHYASHELRTPLTAMVGITENAMDKKLEPWQYEYVLKQLFQQQQNLTEITNSLLLLSDYKIVTEQDYPLIRLDELLFRSVEINQNLYPHALIQFNIMGATHTEEALLVRANEPLLLMAFNNLIKNAVQYSPNHQVMITVRLLGKMKEVEFRNNGNPFQPDEKQSIFTPFYRASNAGRIKGHGLGLPLVKQIAELHGASINYFRDKEFNVFCFIFQQ